MNAKLIIEIVSIQGVSFCSEDLAIGQHRIQKGYRYPTPVHPTTC